MKDPWGMGTAANIFKEMYSHDCVRCLGKKYYYDRHGNKQVCDCPNETCLSKMKITMSGIIKK